MKKKLGDITIREIVERCKRCKNCRDCDLRFFNIPCGAEFEKVEEETLQEEVYL